MVSVDGDGHLEYIEGHAGKGALRGRECMSRKPPGGHLVQDAGFRDEKFGAGKAITSPQGHAAGQRMPLHLPDCSLGAAGIAPCLVHAVNRLEETRHLQGGFRFPRLH